MTPAHHDGAHDGASDAAYDGVRNRDERLDETDSVDTGVGEPQDDAAPHQGGSAVTAAGETREGPIGGPVDGPVNGTVDDVEVPVEDTAGVTAGRPEEAPVHDLTGAPGQDKAQDMSQDMAGDSPNDLVADLAEAQQTLAERTADLQRLQAEYVNYKRRVDRDRELVRVNATYSVLSALLPVLDDIDRAREHGEVEGGFKAVADSLDRAVAGMGLVKFGEPGDEFDPNIHEALMHAYSPDVTTTTCQHIVHAGYRIGDRVVRPARVTAVDPEPTADYDSDYE